MSIKFKLAAINALKSSPNAWDHLALAEIRESVKGRDLQVGDIVINTITGTAHQVDHIQHRGAYCMVMLDCTASVDGGAFTLDHAARIDVYRA